MIKNKILYDHLRDFPPEENDIINGDPSRNKLAHSRVATLLQPKYAEIETPADFSLAYSVVGLTIDDLITFGGASPKFNSEASSTLNRALDASIEALLRYHGVDDDSDKEILVRAKQLVADIETQRTRISKFKTELDVHRNTASSLLKDFNTLHAQLHADLEVALTTLPARVHARRSATQSLLAISIEVSLLKLSLLRADAETALYAHTPTGRPETTVARALTVAHNQLTRENALLDAEGAELDVQLDEYAALLSLVSAGGDGGFVQIADDWARVQQETEECRRDLRRLGWTGD